MFDRALALDPDFAWSLAIRSYVKFHAWFFKWNTAATALKEAIGDAETAVALNSDLPAAHSCLGWMYMWGEGNGHDRALAEQEKALALDPNFAEGYIWYASTLIYSGRPEISVEPNEQGHAPRPSLPANFPDQFWQHVPSNGSVR